MAGTNGQLADIFQQMADVMEIIGVDRFRINAYARVARSLENLTTDVADTGGDLKLLQKIDGVGKGAAERISEYLTTGKVADHENLLSQIPDGLIDLLNIPGLGPKKVSLLWKEAEVNNLADLKEKLKDDQLAALPGMGKKTLENLRKSIAFNEAAGERVRIGVARPLALWFVDKLSRIKGVKDVTYAGSLRRGRETIGDIDLLVSANKDDAKSISEAFIKLGPIDDVLASGATKTSIRTNKDCGSLQVDLRIVPPDSYGAALMYFTGSKEHNVRLRERAIKQKMSLNEYNLSKGDAVIAAATEQDIYKALGLDWIAPELREDRGEIALAEKQNLPNLIELRDIKADLHTHTTASDGKWSIRELAIAAADRGFHTVAITDHSKSQAQANGLNADRLEKHIEDIRAVAKTLKDKITILAGSEVDILADGKLDYPNDLLAELDVVVASPHAALTQDPKKATARLLKAIENPHVTIMGHPTGRLVGRREGLSPDMGALIAAAAERGLAMEINANSYRLDLRDNHARAAIEAGVKLSINTDAHSEGDLDQLIYGILTARRAGATKNDVINCMAADALHQWIGCTS